LVRWKKVVALTVTIIQFQIFLSFKCLL